MLMTRRVPNRSRRSWARFALFLLFLSPLAPSRLAAADLFPGYPASRSHAGRPRGRGGGSREGGGAGAGGPRTSARDVRPRDPFHERRSGPDLRPRGPGRVETRVVRVAARGDPRRAALRPSLVLACLGGRGAVPARGVPLRRRRVVGGASPVCPRAARVRRVGRSVRLRLRVLVRDLGVAQSSAAGASRADVGRRPPLQGSSPAGDLRLRDRPRRFSRPRSRAGPGSPPPRSSGSRFRRRTFAAASS